MEAPETDDTAPESLAFRVPASQENVLQNAQTRPLSRCLKGTDKPQASDTMRRHTLNRGVLENNATRVLEFKPRYEINCGTFTSAIGADKPGHLAFLNSERAVIHSGNAAEMLVKSFNYKNCRFGCWHLGSVLSKRLMYRRFGNRLRNRQRRKSS